MVETDRDELRSAAETLANAREAADDPDASERLDACVERVESMVEAERGPDHGRLARFEHTLRDEQDEVNDEAATLIDETLAHVRAYRETVEGV